MRHRSQRQGRQARVRATGSPRIPAGSLEHRRGVCLYCDGIGLCRWQFSDLRLAGTGFYACARACSRRPWKPCSDCDPRPCGKKRSPIKNTLHIFCVRATGVRLLRVLSGHAAARPACPLRRSLAGPVHVNARIARSMQQPKLARVERLLALVEFCLVAVALAALPKPGQTRARARQRVCVHPRRGARISDSPLTW